MGQKTGINRRRQPQNDEQGKRSGVSEPKGGPIKIQSEGPMEGAFACSTGGAAWKKGWIGAISKEGF